MGTEIRMKKFLLATTILAGAAGAAQSADLPYKAPMMPIVAAANWSGCYVGGTLGGGFAWTQNTATTNGTAGVGDFTPGQGYSNPSSGFVGGGFLGCNYQTGRTVWGIEGSYMGSAIKADFNNPFGNDVYTNKLTDIATVTGRVGMAFDSWLFYSKLGWAGARAQLSYADPTRTGTATVWHNGITIGSGIEYMLTPNWIVGFETNYYRFESKSYELGTAAAGLYTFSSRPRDVTTVLGRVSYKF